MPVSFPLPILNPAGWNKSHFDLLFYQFLNLASNMVISAFLPNKEVEVLQHEA